MLTPGEVLQILSPTHWHNRASTATLNEFTTRKLTSQQGFTTSSSSKILVSTNKISKVTSFRLRGIAHSISSTRSCEWLPSKKKHRNFLRTSKPAKLVISSQHDSVYYQQGIKDDQFLNLSINRRQS
ncbi:hypothetical protein QL285_075132 [Trifolium repens]|nr:hypothetical protein QL285_075132 [Trifolium repens]